jgi:hypothetical protein
MSKHHEDGRGSIQTLDRRGGLDDLAVVTMEEEAPSVGYGIAQVLARLSE